MASTKVTICNKALGSIGAKRITALTDSAEEARVISNVYDDIRDEVLMEHPWSFAQKRAALIDMTKPDVDDWVTATDYVVGDVVEYGGTHYTCLIAHTSGVFSADLTAADWATTTDWTTAKTYSTGDQVYHTGINYTCIVLHTSGVFATDLATNVYWIVSEEILLSEDGVTVIYYLPTDFLAVNFKSYKYAIVKLENGRLLSDTDSLKIIYTYNLDDPSKYSGNFKNALATRLASEICFNLTQSANKAEALLQKYIKIDLPRATSSDSQQSTVIEADQDEWENARVSGLAAPVRPGDQTWHVA